MVDMPHAGSCCHPGGPIGFSAEPLAKWRFDALPRGVEWRERMGLAMSVPQLLIILVIVALIFGTKRLKEVGGDLGSAVKSFRKALNTSGDTTDEPAEAPKQLTRDEEKQ
jgi:sec-independent protein translocase protein TatA